MPLATPIATTSGSIERRFVQVWVACKMDRSDRIRFVDSTVPAIVDTIECHLNGATNQCQRRIDIGLTV